MLFVAALLLPFVSRPDDGSTEGSSPDSATLQKRVKELEDKLKLSEESLKRLMDERAKIAERTLVRVLEIDGDTGDLFYTAVDGPRPVRERIATAGQALELVELTKQKADGQAVYFLVLYPRTRSRFPTDTQVRTYEQWLKGVPHKFDNPFAAK